MAIFLESDDNINKDQFLDKKFNNKKISDKFNDIIAKVGNKSFEKVPWFLRP